MDVTVLGKTGIRVPKNGFGALPVQRVSEAEAVRILRRAWEGGIRFYDTARAYTDSEKKLGEALADVREQIVLASKTQAKTPEQFWKDLETSLKTLKTEYLDIYQFHNPSFCPKPGDGSGLYEAMEDAKRQGMIRHIGITNHRLNVAREAVESGLYETLQFPFSYLATDKDLELVELCRQADMGLIAMKGLSGGLISNSAAAYAYMRPFPHVEPIWGIQRMEELEEFLSYMEEPPEMTDEMRQIIDADRKELSGNFCRGCGYCMPCPAGIEINTCARMSLMIRRSPSEKHLTEKAQAMMEKIRDCLHCGVCRSKCPYGLDTPALLEENYRDYQDILAGKVKI